MGSLDLRVGEEDPVRQGRAEGHAKKLDESSYAARLLKIPLCVQHFSAQLWNLGSPEE